MKLRGFDLNEKGSPGEDSGSGEGELGSSLEKETAAERIEDGEFAEESESEGFQLVEDESKRSWEEDTEDNEDVSSIKKRLKREGLDCKLQLPGTGRALRSRFAVKNENEEEVDQGVGVDVVAERDEVDNSEKVVEVKRKRGRPPKVQQITDRLGGEGIEVELEESNFIGNVAKGELDLNDRPNGVQLSDESADRSVKVEDGHQFGDDGQMVIQVSESPCYRKRGRPPKVQDRDSVEKSKIVCGRDRDDSLNVVAPGSEIRKRGRGRPPKVNGGQGVVRGDSNGGKKLYELRKGDKESKLKNSSKLVGPVKTKLSKQIVNRKSSKAKRLGPSKKTNDGDTQSGDDVALQGVELEPKSPQKERSVAKQAVRDKIIGLLMGAGWTIDYRPRNGREYNDAVYVNPEGKTHWSITKAYRALKESFESGNVDSETSNFTFTPIPVEELSILYKVMTKKREVKKKSNGKKRDESMETEGEAGKEKAMRKRKSKRKRRDGDEADGWKNGRKSKKQRRKSNLTGKGRHDNSVVTLSGRKYKPKETQNRKRCALLVRNSMKGANADNDGYVLYDGKRTVLSWMIDLGAVALDERVKYMNQSRTLVIQEGRITRDGIFCECCSEVFGVVAFESHTGSKLNEPFQNICLETEKSLMQCMHDSWNKQEEAILKGFHFVDVSGEDPNDDTCGVCGDGGDLICCDGCPSTFHKSCLHVKKFPTGEWYCIFCTCKFCGMVGEKMKPKESENDEALSELLTCSLCEEKYHQVCIQMKGTASDDSGCPSFCGKKCEELSERLQMLVGVRHELQDGFSWTLTHRFDVSSDVCLKEAYQKVESNAKLAVALSVMDECFLPHVDHRSGVNLIPNIIYNFGSNFNRLNYSGFFTGILERGDEVIAAASIRIHGNQLAEMPFIGTRYTHRRQGMCRRLLNAIESALSSLAVEKLVIPAISEMKESWISVFGFKPLNTSSKQNMRKLNILAFPGVDMLQKPLLMKQSAEENTTHTEGGVAAPDKSTMDLDSQSNKVSEMKVNEDMVKDDTNLNHEVDAVRGSEDSGQNIDATEMPNDPVQASPSACQKAKDVPNGNHAGFDAIEKADLHLHMTNGVAIPEDVSTPDSCEAAMADDHEPKATEIPDAKQNLNGAQNDSESPKDLKPSGNMSRSDHPESGETPRCASM